MNEFFQNLSQYHFFIPDIEYFRETALHIGGVTFYISEFLMQFFIFPWVGISILLLISGLSGYLSKQYIPAAAMLLLMTDKNFTLQGLVAYLFVALSIWLYCKVSRKIRRWITLFSLGIILFCIAPAASYLFALCAFASDWVEKRKMMGMHLIHILSLVLIGWVSVELSITDEWRMVLLPDAFHNYQLTPPDYFYAIWALLPLSILIGKVEKRRLVIGIQAVMAVVVVSWWYQVDFTKVYKESRVRMFDLYAWHENWDAIIENYPAKTTNRIEMSILNMALCNKRVDPQQIFQYDQRGVEGLTLQWNKDVFISTILSDIAFAAGDIASSQQYAFEGLVSTTGYTNPRLLERLIQTNLIIGEYRVAQKYIALLERSWLYKRRASYYKYFVTNPSLIDNDPLLSSKRACLPPTRHFAGLNGLMSEIQQLAQSNNHNLGARWYLQAAILLYQKSK